MTAAAGSSPETTVEITVDGQSVTAAGGEMLIAACERAGTYIPRFCYHPRMTPVGMCRMCLVEIDTGRGASLQPSCMVPVAADMSVFTESEAAKKAQEGVLEFLLINHPLDCPICDKGGECPLQDQTMSYGPGESRFVEQKRHFAKPIPISETVYLDRERCILCDRCTRFADEVAGDALIHFMGRGNDTQVNTYPREPFASYFSGNTVQICPVGALTAKPYRFKARPWDLTETISTAWVDSMGARIAVQASRNQVLRVLGVDADAVNWGWLSDKERFGFEALNSPERLLTPLRRAFADDASASDDVVFQESGWGEALDRVQHALSAASPERVAVLGGARLTNEAQYMWAKLAKGVIGTDNVDAQLGDGLDPRVVLGLPSATINDACRQGGTVLLIGCDPKEELGTLFLRLRHAVINDGVTLIEITPCATGLSGLAAHSLRVPVDALAATARYLVTAATRTRSTSEAPQPSQPSASASLEVDELEAAAAVLAQAEGGVTVIVGRASLAGTATAVEAAAFELAKLPSVRFLPALRRGNIHGALRAGLSPGLLPGGVWLQDPDTEPAGELGQLWPGTPRAEGLYAAGILQAAAAGEIDVLILLGADPVNDFTDRDLACRGLRGAGMVVAVDLFVNDSNALAAEVVLAAAGPTECDGTFTNIEGRVSLTTREVTPPGTARPDWLIAAELAERLSPGSGLETVEQIRSELARVSEMHRPVTEQALADSRIEGLLLDPTGALTKADMLPVDTTFVDGASECDTTSGGDPDGGSLRLVASRTMYDDGVMLRHCPSSRGLAASATARLNPAESSRRGITAGTSVRVSTNAGHLDMLLAADEGVPEGCLAVNWLAPEAPANTLLTVGESVTYATLTALATSQPSSTPTDSAPTNTNLKAVDASQPDNTPVVALTDTPPKAR